MRIPSVYRAPEEDRRHVRTPSRSGMLPCTPGGRPQPGCPRAPASDDAPRSLTYAGRPVRLRSGCRRSRPAAERSGPRSPRRQPLPGPDRRQRPALRRHRARCGFRPGCRDPRSGGLSARRPGLSRRHLDPQDIRRGCRRTPSPPASVGAGPQKGQGDRPDRPVFATAWSSDLETNVSIAMFARRVDAQGTRIVVEAPDGRRPAIVREPSWP